MTGISAALQSGHRVTVVGMTEEERTRAFRRAKWNSVRVRILRFAFPVLAVGLLGIYGLVMRHTVTLDNGPGGETAEVSFRAASLSRDNLKMANPRYEGFSDDGAEYVVEAQSATMGTQRTEPIKLDMITGTLSQPNNTITRLAARFGTYEQATGQMTLSGGIKIESTAGLAAQLSSAQIDPKAGMIVSDEISEVSMPSGKIVGRSLRIDQKQRLVTFGNGVEATMKLPAKPPGSEGASVEAQDQTGETAVPAFATASDEPVVVNAETLVVADGQSVATFRQNVRAVQGDAELQAAVLAIAYQRSGRGQNESGASSMVGEGSGNVRSVVAEDNVILRRGVDTIAAARATFEVAQESGVFEGGVRITSGDDRSATAETVTFDQRRQTAVLTGGVKVRQGENLLTGGRLEIDQDARTLELTNPVEANVAGEAPAAGRIAARFQPPAATGAGAGGSDQKPASSNSVAGNWSFKSNPDAPIDIAANRLRVDDAKKTAVFDGKVNAAQGPIRLSANVLNASYTGSGSIMAGAEPADGQQIRSIRADGNVVVTSDQDQRARGDWAVFDLAANTVTVGGDVELKQGRQVLRGDRLVIDLTTGLTRLTMQPSAAAASQPDGDGKRMRATFYPTDIQNAGRSAGEGSGNRPQQRPEGARPPSTSSWAPTPGPN